jgi:hypothetical protein
MESVLSTGLWAVLVLLVIISDLVRFSFLNSIQILGSHFGGRYCEAEQTTVDEDEDDEDDD